MNLLIVCLLFVCLAGCASRERSVNGQVFIVTENSENVKLGLVEVSFVERQEVERFLKQKSQAVPDLKQRLKTAVGEAEAKLAVAQKELEDLDTTYAASRKNYAAAKERGGSLTSQEASLISWYEANLKPKEEALRSEIGRLEHLLRNAQREFMDFPSLDFYLSDPLPNARYKSTTDADGKFAVSIPREKDFAILAQASRQIGNATERFVWFLWVPEKLDKAPVLLSNNNLVQVENSSNVLPFGFK